jgi:hypothetical protein
MTAAGGEFEKLGSEQIDHQHNYPEGGAGAASVASALPGSIHRRGAEQASYFCRGCGRKLPPSFRGHFHRECLRTDKRRRIQSRRVREREEFARWLRHAVCPHCGVTFGNSASGRSKECPCEASQAAQEGSQVEE